jgi:hypothetical protein
MIRELIDTELETVAGGAIPVGKVDLTLIGQTFKATNKVDQHASSFALFGDASSLNVVGAQSISGGNNVG